MNNALSLIRGSDTSRALTLPVLASSIKGDLERIRDRYFSLPQDDSWLLTEIDFERADEYYRSWRVWWPILLSDDSPFFLIYVDIPGLEWTISHIASSSESLSDFLDGLALHLASQYEERIKKEVWDKEYALSYTSTGVYVSQSPLQEEWTFTREILYEYVRYFILERWLPLPKLYFSEWPKVFFEETLDDSIAPIKDFILKIERSLWVDNTERVAHLDDPTHRVPAIRFLTKIIEKALKLKSSRIDFILGNAIAFYLKGQWKYISSRAFQDVIKPFLGQRESLKNSMLWYMFCSVAIPSFGIENLIHRLWVQHHPADPILLSRYTWWWETDMFPPEITAMLGDPGDIIPSIILGNPWPFPSSVLKDPAGLILSGPYKEYLLSLARLAWEIPPHIRPLAFLVGWDGASSWIYALWESGFDPRRVAEHINNIMTNRDRIIAQTRRLLNRFSSLQLPRVSTIGWKVHFYSPPQADQIKKISQIIPEWGFSLIHANTTLNLPPCNSPIELVAILYKLIQIGVIQDDQLDIQLSVPVRLPSKLCAVLGSAMIWMKSYQTYYPKDAFRTSHDNLTGACIIAYDAGVLVKDGFGTIDPVWTGRTDILWIKKAEEAYVFHVLSEILRCYYLGWIYREAWREFLSGYRKILEKYHFDWVLNEKWVHNPDVPMQLTQNDYNKHADMIETCTQLLNRNITSYNSTWDTNWLMIFEIRALFSQIAEKYGLVYDFPRVERLIHDTLWHDMAWVPLLL